MAPNRDARRRDGRDGRQRSRSDRRGSRNGGAGAILDGIGMSQVRHGKSGSESLRGFEWV